MFRLVSALIVIALCVVVAAIAHPEPAGANDGGRHGLATWYCLSSSSACTHDTNPDDLVAAVDSELGYRKGDRITVHYGAKSVTVTVVDVCGCPGERLIDLTSGAFQKLAPLSAGVIPVSITAAGSRPRATPPRVRPRATPPATDTAG